MSFDLYKNKADILATKETIEGFRYKPEDFDLFITEKARAFEDPANQNIDYAVEMHVYSPAGDWLGGDHRLESVRIPRIQARRQFLQLDLRKELEEVGIERGSYKLVFNFMKSLLGNTENRSLFIKEVSPSRKEVWLTIADPLSTELTPDDDIKNTLDQQFKQFKKFAISEQDKGLSNVVLNLGNNRIFKAVNVRIGGKTRLNEIGESRLHYGQNIYLKLYDELPTDIVTKSRAWIAQEDKRPVIENVNVYPEIEKPTFNILKGPNFEIDQEYSMQTETDFQAWNDLLDTNTSTTQQIIDKMFSGSLSGINLNVDFTKFENFVKYSSAEERLKNFRYKLQLIEHYDTQLAILSNASGSDSGSLAGNERINTKRKNEVIGGFDAFERWAYNEPTASLFTHGVTGSTLFAQPYSITPYPKFLQNGSYVRYHSTSSLGETWLNGYIASASLFDLENEDSLINSIPENIGRDSENSQYLLFVNMIGHHYDILYSYINELTRFHDTEEHPKLGVPGELLYDVAKSMGWYLANGNQAEALWQYKLGKTQSGSFQSTGSLFSKSSEDISHEVWRRIVNNMPHILKTKGTKRSVHALMNTYGIPRTLLSIREYGGPKAPEQEPDLIEDRFSYALQFQSGSVDGTQSPHIVYGARDYTTNIGSWGYQRVGLSSGAEIPPQTREFRFKPGITQSMLLLSTTVNNAADGTDIRTKFQLAVQHTASYSGSGKYGRLVVSHGRGLGTFAPITGSTDWLPLYDGEFWNVRWYWQYNGSGSVQYNQTDNANTTYHIECQRAADYIEGKIVHSGSFSYTPTDNAGRQGWLVVSSNQAKQKVRIGGYPGLGNSRDQFRVNTYLRRFIEDDNSISFTNANGPNLMTFSGSMQEYREWLEDIGSGSFREHTLNPTSYVSGKSPTSSFDTLIRHYPLGSDTIAVNHFDTQYQILSSSHPAQTIVDAQLPFVTSSFDNRFDLINSGSSFASMSFFPNGSTQRGNYERLTETYYVDAPSIGGTNTNSMKIRLEDSKLVGVLDPMAMAERSRYDYATLDSNRLGLFYSAADWINRDIFNQIGRISLDDFFGSPEDEFNVEYPDLESIAFQYWKKFDRRNDINAYIKIFSMFDFSLFTQLKQLIPVRANAAMGVLVEPNILERAKVQVSERPIITNPQYEQRITTAISEVTASTLPLSASLFPTRPITGSTLPLSASLAASRPITASAVPIISQSADIELPGPDVSGSEILSHKGSARQLDAAYVALLGPTVSSSIVPTNYKLENFLRKRTFKGVVYPEGNVSAEGPVIVSDYALGRKPGSNLTDVDYDRSVTASAAFQAVILEQRKSLHYKKKVAHFTPRNKVTRHYAMNEFVSSTSPIMLDISNPYGQGVAKTFPHTGYAHSISYLKKAAGDGTHVNIAPSTATFETISHNFFTGSALIFDNFAAQSTFARGAELIRIPRVNFTNGATPAGNGSKFSVSALLQPASQSGKTPIAWAGESGTTNPGFWIATDGTLVLRDQTGTYYGSLSVNTAQPGTKISNIGSWPVTQGGERPYHIVYTFDGTSGSNGVAKYYVNGKFQHSFTRIGHTTGSGGVFYLEEIGNGYQSGGNSYGYSGSIAHVQIFDNHVLTDEEIKYLNKFPHLRANRDKKGNETFTRREGQRSALPPGNQISTQGGNTVKNILFAQDVYVGVPTSHSLEAADYRDDEFAGLTRKLYEGSKLTGPDFNINTTATTDGGPVVSFTVTNPNTLTTKEGNLTVK